MILVQADEASGFVIFVRDVADGDVWEAEGESGEGADLAEVGGMEGVEDAFACVTVERWVEVEWER